MPSCAGGDGSVRVPAVTDPNRTRSHVEAFWDDQIVPTLIDYVRIPNKSPSFDPDWEANGHMNDVLELALAWLERNPVPGSTVHVGRAPGRTPLILVDCPGTGEGDTVLMYGHLDKQPEMEGWLEGLGPWIPKIIDDKLYGRGAADDGYALFASVAALRALHEQGVARNRVVLIIEFSEESGSPDLPYWVDQFSDTIGTVDLVVCLDSGAGNYEQLWSTTSLRGMMGGSVRVDVLSEGVHSGDASGIVPGTVRVIRQLLDRIEDATTGAILVDELHVDIPPSRVAQAERVAGQMADAIAGKYPFLDGVAHVDGTPAELILNRTWRPTVTVTGCDGIPAVRDAGNVMRPYTKFKLSFRLPPTLDPDAGREAVVAALTSNPPHGAKVTANFEDAAAGWNAPDLAPWLEEALDAVSETYFSKPALHMGEGGTIPFMGMLHAKFPAAQFVITGVLGPQSNAHGPNEFLHLPYAKLLTCCVADLVALHHISKTSP
ncbi:MAG: M20/M25/M40 family metallo-hydrolase [Proteobacteria bacterium]|nr:M20/M25/M40 family metallo-hydrolase [Pseudomonadota bacterium]